MVIYAKHTYFNPLGRKTETKVLREQPELKGFQSTRSQDRDCPYCKRDGQFKDFNPLGRKTETSCSAISAASIRHFNPLGRKTETRLPDHPDPRSSYFNPLGRKTET